MRLFISHSAERGDDPGDWFIVEPREGCTSRSIAGTLITPESAVASLVDAGRTVYELEVTPFLGRDSVHAGAPRTWRARARMILRWRQPSE